MYSDEDNANLNDFFGDELAQMPAFQAFTQHLQ